MKRVVISVLIIFILVFLVGCLDYKAYDVPKNTAGDSAASNTDEEKLLDEIAQIEADLDAQESEETEVESEVVLPELDEEETPSSGTEETSVSGDYDYLITVDENQMAKLNLKVSDPDQDNISYTFSPPLDKKGQWKTNYGDAGEYLIALTATDGKLTTTKKIKLVVNRVNVPPVISGVKDLYAKEGETIQLEPEVTDPNKDPVTVSITEPLKTGTFVTDHTSAGDYQITILASDGELETKKSIKLSIQNVNVLPEISNLEDIYVKEGEKVEIKPEVSDLDGDAVAVTISNPVGDDGIWETSFIDHGTYTILVTADDGKDQVTEKVKITVEDVNMPPDITDVSLDIS